MSKGIRVSEKHGVNPSITICPICGKETGIALLGKLKGDKEAPMSLMTYLNIKLCLLKKNKFRI